MRFYLLKSSIASSIITGGYGGSLPIGPLSGRIAVMSLLNKPHITRSTQPLKVASFLHLAKPACKCRADGFVVMLQLLDRLRIVPPSRYIQNHTPLNATPNASHVAIARSRCSECCTSPVQLPYKPQTALDTMDPPGHSITSRGAAPDLP